MIINEKMRGRGLAKELIRTIRSHPALVSLRRFCLATKDAHRLYESFGFSVTENPQNWMEIKDNNIYQRDDVTETR